MEFGAQMKLLNMFFTLLVIILGSLCNMLEFSSCAKLFSAYPF